MGGCVGLRTGVYTAEEKNLDTARNRTLAIQPIETINILMWASILECGETTT
jgi:hypothetical protein